MSSRSTQPEETTTTNPPRKTDRKGRRPNSPAASWEPDLILSADVGRDGQPAPPPDPTWHADLILVDEARFGPARAEPLDPNWKPDVVLNDETAEDATGENAARYARSAAAYRSLFRANFRRADPKKRTKALSRT